MAKRSSTKNGAEGDRPGPDPAVTRGIQLEIGEVFVWDSPNGRLFGFVPVSASN